MEAKKEALSPCEAWCQHIKTEASEDQRWMEDSKKVSEDLPLSKRELFGLILLAILRGDEGSNWVVGYDDEVEPNDGFIAYRDQKLFIEHTIVPQIAKGDPVDSIIDAFMKKNSQGFVYGSDRILIVHSNQNSYGAVPVSDLKDVIDEFGTVFDKVFLICCVDFKAREAVAVMQIYQCDSSKSNGVSQVDFELRTGSGTVRSNKSNWD